MGIIMHID